MPIFTAIGTALGFSAVAATAGGATAFGVGVGVAAAAAGTTAAVQAGAKSERIVEKKATETMNRMNALAKSATDPANAQATAQAKTRQRLSSMTQSVYTSPLGIGGQAELGVKSLLGK